MYHLDNTSGVPEMPEPKEQQSMTPRWFGESQEQGGISWPGADWFNIVQAELLNAVFNAGLTLDKLDNSQLSKAIGILGGDLLRRQLGSSDPEQGSEIVKFLGSVGQAISVGEYLREGYIRVSSREELLEAIKYVNNDTKKKTEIRLSRNFAPWNAPKTDIDLTYVCLVGEGDGAVIDAQGIPDQPGNYWARFFNSGKSNIKNLANLQGIKLKGMSVIGPSRASSVICRLFSSPEGAVASMATQSCSIQEFGVGDEFRTNAYIIDHYNPDISRCGIHAYMPGGYSNYGEAIRYHGGSLSTSRGVAVQNDNQNGAIRLFGTSVDYVGRVAVCNRGRIELKSCHQEFNNSSNPLIGLPPYYCGNGGECRLLISGGEIHGWIRELGVESVFHSEPGGNGIHLIDVSLQNLVTTTEYINSGSGDFNTDFISVIDGNGNTRVSMLKSPSQNLLADPDFTRTEIVDWYLFTDTSAITSRTTGANLQLTVSSLASRVTGGVSMEINKKFGVGSGAVIRAIVPAKENALSQYELFLKSVGCTGSIFITTYFYTLQYKNQYGTPIGARGVQFGAIRSVNAADLTEWGRVAQQSIRRHIPAWAEYVMIEISLTQVSPGKIYLDDALVTQL